MFVLVEVEEQKKAAVYVPPSKRVGGASPMNTATSQGQSQLSENEKKARAIKKVCAFKYLLYTLVIITLC